MATSLIFRVNVAGLLLGTWLIWMVVLCSESAGQTPPKQSITDAANAPPMTLGDFLRAASASVSEAMDAEFAPGESTAVESSRVGSTRVDADASSDDPITMTTSGDFRWWNQVVAEGLLPSDASISLDLASVMTDAIELSPRITALSRRTSIAYEQIIQQDAVFDTALLMQSGVGRVNDPVGNTLTTGGPPRLLQDNFTASAGIRRQTRTGGVVDLSQELGTLTSNSQFFLPLRQGNSRLSLSLTQPLMAGAGKAYNARLITQASIDARIAWTQLRAELQQQLVDAQTAFWRLYERRCQLIQQRDLIARSRKLHDQIHARVDLDAGPLSRLKVQRRLSDHIERELELTTDVRRLQIQLRTILGGDARSLNSGASDCLLDAGPVSIPSQHHGVEIELLPLADPLVPAEMIGPGGDVSLRDALVRALENRPDVRAATEQLSAAALTVRVTRNELKPRLDAVFDAYLAGLNGRNNFLRSFGDQFADGGPGLTATLQYELPHRNRAARSRHREAKFLYQQRAEELRQTLVDAHGEVETALVSVQASRQMRDRRADTLSAAINEESVATHRFALLAGDTASVPVMVEDLLETQTRRTMAEQAYVTAEVDLVLALVQLQTAMGTLLTRERVDPARPGLSTHIEVSTGPGMPALESSAPNFPSSELPPSFELPQPIPLPQPMDLAPDEPAATSVRNPVTPPRSNPVDVLVQPVGQPAPMVTMSSDAPAASGLIEQDQFSVPARESPP